MAQGVLSRMNTAPAYSGTGVKPLVHRTYAGGAIVLPDDPAQVLSPDTSPYLASKVGDDIVTASGATLLGADDKAGVAIVPAGPAGRAPNLYTPPWAIPIGSDMAEEAWALARFLTSDAQLIEDGERSAAVEAASLPVLYSAAFDRAFRDDLLQTVRASRAVARLERPFSGAGMAANEIVGNTVHAALQRHIEPEAALQKIEADLRILVAST